MNNNIIKIAHQLAIMFQDDSDIPERFKKGKIGKITKFRKDSLIESRFQEHVNSWSNSITSILKNVDDNHQAWRFIKLKPQIRKDETGSVTTNGDFIAFTQLLIKRRDIDNCDPIELGHLCSLSTAFQQKIKASYELFSH